MIIMPVKPGSKQWLDERRLRITASDTPKILGFSRWGTGLDVCLEKWGEDQKGVPSQNLLRGIALESPVASAYQMLTKLDLDPSCFVVHDKHSWMAATPDRFIRNNGGLVQIKTHLDWLSDEYGESGSQIYPEAEYLQILHELEVTGKDYADLVVLFGDDKIFDLFVDFLDRERLTEHDIAIHISERMDLRIFRIEKNKRLQKYIVDAGKDFYEKYVIPHKIPPDAPTFENKDDIRKATEEEAIQIQKLKARWLDYQSAEIGLEDMKAKIKHLIGEDAGIDAGNGDKVTFKKNKDSVSKITNWEGIAKEIKVPKEIIAAATEPVVNWEKAVKASPTLKNMPSELWDKILSEYTQTTVTRKGTRVFRVPDRKWKKEL